MKHLVMLNGQVQLDQILTPKNAWKTDQQIAAERSGSDFDENVQRKFTENNAKAKANESIVRLEKTTYSESRNVTESTTVSKDE